MKTDIFKSERLCMVRPGPRELYALEQWIRDPEIMRFQNGVWVGKHKEDFFEFIDWHWRKFGFGHYIGVKKEDQTPVGLFSIKYLTKGVDLQSEIPDLGCLIAKEFWRMGFASEGAKGLVKYAFESLGFKEVGALNYPENAIGSRLLRTLGFREVGSKEVFYHGQNFGTATMWKLKADSVR